jgi:hypothetical protein
MRSLFFYPTSETRRGEHPARTENIPPKYTVFVFFIPPARRCAARPASRITASRFPPSMSGARWKRPVSNNDPSISFFAFSPKANAKKEIGTGLRIGAIFQVWREV